MALLTRIFVYGTLKKGLPNHKLLCNLKTNEIVKFVGNARTVEKYPLLVTTSAFIPFMLDCAGRGGVIDGEVYEVCENVLAKLDDLEDVGVLYDRKKISVAVTDANTNNKEEIDANVYIITNYRSNLLDLEFISNFTEEHGNLYKAKTDRSIEYAKIIECVKA